MDAAWPAIFISYARGDGADFAKAFEHRLAEQGITAWRDQAHLEGGEDISDQLLRAIEEAKHLVLILTQRALTSAWVKREWTHARTVGTKISPILGEESIRIEDLPNWMQRVDIYDINIPERWTRLVRVLEGPGDTRRVHYMVGDQPDHFVARQEEYDRAKLALLRGGRTVALTTALHGAGGYGKTTLGNALCRDPDIQCEFSDGVLRVELGKETLDITSRILNLIELIDPRRHRPSVTDLGTAADLLAETLGEARILLVLDDVSRESQLRPFLRGGPNCVRLVTTRIAQSLPADHVAVRVDEMTTNQSLAVLAKGLPGLDDVPIRLDLAALAKRLGFWGQMLSIANGWLVERVRKGATVSGALAEFNSRLTRRGLAAFDSRIETQRHRTVALCIDVSLEELNTEAERCRFDELGILPEDTDVPISVIAALWAVSGGMDLDSTDELLSRLDGLSLLQKLR